MFQRAISHVPTDVIIETKNGCIFRTHKCLLNAISPVFSAMLSSEMKEGKNNKIVLDETSEIVDTFFEMIYDNSYKPNSTDLCFKLYQFYDKYDIKADEIVKLIIFRTNEKNIIDHFKKWFQFTNSNDLLLKKLAAKLKKYVAFNSKIDFIINSLIESYTLRLQDNILLMQFIEKLVNEHDSLSFRPLIKSEHNVYKDAIKRLIMDFIENVSNMSNRKHMVWCSPDFCEFDELNEFVTDYLKADNKSMKLKIVSDLIDKIASDRYSLGKEKKEMMKEEIMLEIFDEIENDKDKGNSVSIFYSFMDKNQQFDSFSQFINNFDLTLIEKIEQLYVNVEDLCEIWNLDLKPEIFKIIYHNDLPPTSFKNKSTENFSSDILRPIDPTFI